MKAAWWLPALLLGCAESAFSVHARDNHLGDLKSALSAVRDAGGAHATQRSIEMAYLVTEDRKLVGFDLAAQNNAADMTVELGSLTKTCYVQAVPSYDVSYYYAYSDAGYGGTAPTIAINVSTDCGVTWNQVHSISAKETGQPTTAGTLYDPKSGEYQYVIVPLTAYAGKAILVRITGTPGTTGNALYIDEVRINSASVLSVSNRNMSNPHVLLSPNPVNNTAQVDFELAKPSDVVFTVYNLLSQVVFTKKSDMQSSGTHTETFDFSGLNSGMYMLEVKSGEAVSTKKFIKN